MRLILHIGTHKTGTSAIQVALRSAEGITFPEAGLMKTTGHLNLAWEASSDARFRAFRGTTSDMVDEVRRSADPVVVVSAETLTSKPWSPVFVDWASNVVETLQPDELLVVGAVRPQWQYFESLFTQQVKVGAPLPVFPQYVAKNLDLDRFDYQAVFAGWRARFGNALVVLPYSDNMVVDFWRVARLDGEPARPRSNRRPSAESVEVFRMLGNALANTTDKHTMAEVFRCVRQDMGYMLWNGEPFRGLDKKLVQRITDRWSDRNMEFAADYGIDPNYFKAPESVPKRTNVRRIDVKDLSLIHI